MKLSDWAKQHGINYQTAYRWYKAGRLPAAAYQADTGTIIINDNKNQQNNDQKENNMSELINYRRNKEDEVYKFIKQIENLITYENLPIKFPLIKSNLNLESNNFYPKFKWFTKEDKYIFTCALPGFEEKNIKISVKNNILNISAKSEDLNEENQFLYEKESLFNQSWTLASDAACSEINAKFNNGILNIIIPKLNNNVNNTIDVPINK